MQEMNNDQMILYKVLKESLKARNSNWEAVREFYWEAYGVNLPLLENMPSIWTIERNIRQLKATYKDLRGSNETQQAKLEKVAQYKEMALDKNKPIRPTETKYEEIEFRWY